MRTIKIYGTSDDLFEIEGSKKEEPDEIGCYDKPVAVSIIDKQGNGLIVGGFYSLNKWKSETSSWKIVIELLEEDKHLPNWNMKWGTNSNGYSPELTIEIPDDAVIKQIF